MTHFVRLTMFVSRSFVLFCLAFLCMSLVSLLWFWKEDSVGSYLLVLWLLYHIRVDLSRGNLRWGVWVEVLVPIPGCEQSVNMLNNPLFTGFFDFLTILSKIVCPYKLWDYTSASKVRWGWFSNVNKLWTSTYIAILVNIFVTSCITTVI